MYGGEYQQRQSPYFGQPPPSNTMRVPWSGYYVQNGQQHPMNLSDLMITPEGRIFCEGSDGIGGFRIDGQINPNGSFYFNKQYHGQHSVSYNGTISTGCLSGHWSLPGMRDEFKITFETQKWQGSFVFNGQTFPMRTTVFISEQGIFGLGKDSEGVFVSLGAYNPGSHQLQYTKNYIGKYTITYTGSMFDDGQYFVVNGNWDLSTGQKGTFEMYQKIEGRAAEMRSFYQPPQPPQSFVPVFFGMPQDQIPPQYQGGYHQGMGMGAGIGSPITDMDFIDGDPQEVVKVVDKLRNGAQISGSQIERYLSMIQGDENLLFFCKALNKTNVKDFSIDNLVEGCSRCKNQDFNKTVVIQLHPLVTPVPGALENSRMSKLFVFSADRKFVCKELSITI